MNASNRNHNGNMNIQSNGSNSPPVVVNDVLCFVQNYRSQLDAYSLGANFSSEAVVQAEELLARFVRCTSNNVDTMANQCSPVSPYSDPCSRLLSRFDLRPSSCPQFAVVDLHSLPLQLSTDIVPEMPRYRRLFQFEHCPSSSKITDPFPTPNSPTNLKGIDSKFNRDQTTPLVGGRLDAALKKLAKKRKERENQGGRGGQCGNGEMPVENGENPVGGDGNLTDHGEIYPQRAENQSIKCQRPSEMTDSSTSFSSVNLSIADAASRTTGAINTGSAFSLACPNTVCYGASFDPTLYVSMVRNYWAQQTFRPTNPIFPSIFYPPRLPPSTLVDLPVGNNVQEHLLSPSGEGNDSMDGELKLNDCEDDRRNDDKVSSSPSPSETSNRDDQQRQYSLDEIERESVDKPFKCRHSHCHKRFANKFLLKKHEFIHTGERPHQCLHCLKKFNRKDNLLRHTKTTHKSTYKTSLLTTPHTMVFDTTVHPLHHSHLRFPSATSEPVKLEPSFSTLHRNV